MGQRVSAVVPTWLAAVTLLAAACSSRSSCPAAAPVSGPCHDLVLHGTFYDEWHAVKRPRILQEVGNSTYPACNLADRCGGDPMDGNGATDVWRYHHRPWRDVVIGLREGTHDVYVAYVRVGVDPATLTSSRR